MCMLDSRPESNYDKKTKITKLIQHTTNRTMVDYGNELSFHISDKNMPYMAKFLRYLPEVKIKRAVF